MNVEQQERQAPMTHKKDENTDSDDIEFIINDIGGSFGTFQLLNYALYSITIAISGIVVMTYVFTALNLDYRCIIPECDNQDSPQYNTNWMSNVIPIVDSKPSKCYRYEELYFYQRNQSEFKKGYCEGDTFNHAKQVRCDQNGLVYRTNEISILNEFNLTCEENEYKLAMMGTYNNVARLLFMPIVGILSDRFGRKFVLILGLTLSSIVGISQSFSTSYSMYIMLEFLAASTAAGVFPAAFILSIEWASTDHRVTVSQLTLLSYNLGIALSGVFAAYAREFRLFLRMAYTPGLVTAILMLCSCESLRWLMAKGKQNGIEVILKRAAKINRRQISPRTMEIVRRKCGNPSVATDGSSTKTEAMNDVNSLKHIFTSRILFIRFAISSFSWVVGTFITYGVSIISVSIHEDKYMSFILVALGGLPAGILTILFLKYLGRSKSISICLFIAGLSIVGTKLLPSDYTGTAVIFFMLGKCFGSVAFQAVYVQTSEIWPTHLRHSVLALSSTIGRFGSILAPLTPLLANISEFLPYLTFGIVSIICGILVLFLPETLDRALPETLEDARNLGKKKNELS